MNPKFLQRLRRAKFMVVVGLGGSALPLKAFVDFFQLQDRVHFLDTVDPVRWEKISKLKGAVFCVVSKSGETLEIKALLAEIVATKRLRDLLIVTDRDRGMLRAFAEAHRIETLPVPSDIGGRFTNFTVFHQAILEACGVKLKLEVARRYKEELQKDSKLLALLYRQIFESQKSILVLWGYGDKTLGFCQWAQQVLAESLGKRRKNGERTGITPLVLQGPQDQHSVLQLLSDGPQDKVLWFFESAMAKATKKRKIGDPLREFSKIGLSESLSILAESTYKTFQERLENPETLQPLQRFTWRGTEDFIRSIVLIQAFTEYAGDRLGINAFDQPGVERGKQIARELIRAKTT